MNIVHIIIQLVGGLGIFMYGLSLTSSGLERMAARRMRSVLQVITNNPLLGVLFGIILTIFMQSSSALTVLVVSLVSANLLNLRQALGMVLGSAIGTTFTVQLIAFKVTDYALVAVGIGVLLFFFKGPQIKLLGQAILGFGFIFYGMDLMSTSMEPLKEMQKFVELIIHYSESTGILLFVSLLFTFVIQSSAATIALAMSLADQGLIPLAGVIPIVLGANIGTTGTAFISSLASSREAKRVAIAHVLFKVIGVLIILPFLEPFTRLVEWTSPELTRQIANSNTIFNVFNLLIFFAFIPAIASLMTRLIPDKSSETYSAKFIELSMIGLPDLAYSQTKKEIIYAGRFIYEEMFKNLLTMLQTGNQKLFSLLSEVESRSDEWYKMVTSFLSEVAKGDLTEEQMEEEIKLLYFVNDIENIGDDLIVLAHYGEKLQNEGLVLADQDWRNLTQLYRRIEESYLWVLEALEKDDQDLAQKVIYLHPEILRMEKDLRFEHYNRTNKDPDSFRITSVYLDIVSDMIRVHKHLVSIAQTMLGIV